MAANQQDRQVLRLPKRHSKNRSTEADAQLGGRLADGQSMRAAIVAGMIAIVVFGAGWATLSVLIGRVFPWLTVVQGVFIGLAVRYAGRGLDWRFPVIAAVLAVAGALLGNVVVSAANTAHEFGTGTLTVLRAVTEYTWPVFFDEVMTAADGVYAVAAAGVAAFYANRRLTRTEFVSLRLWQQENDNAGKA